jgi:hypothetical protein
MPMVPIEYRKARPTAEILQQLQTTEVYSNSQQKHEHPNLFIGILATVQVALVLAMLTFQCHLDVVSDPQTSRALHSNCNFLGPSLLTLSLSPCFQSLFPDSVLKRDRATHINLDGLAANATKADPSR